MTEWKQITATLTKEEVEIIDKFAKQLGTNRSQIIKKSVSLAISVTKIYDLIHNSDPKTKQILEGLKTMMLNGNFQVPPDYLMKLLESKFMESLKPLVDRIKNIVREGNSFFEHNPRGAPKKKKQKRGHPEDTGLD